MRVWIDGQCLQTGSRTRGIGRYVLGLISGLRVQPEIDLQISFNAAFPDALILARDTVADWIPRQNVHVWQGVSEGGEGEYGYTPSRRASELALEHHVACLSPDLALNPSMFEGLNDASTPLLSAHGIPTAGIAYDFIPRHYPQRFLPSSAMRAAYERRIASLLSMQCILAISDFTRREVEFLGYRGKITTIDAGPGVGFEGPVEVRPRKRGEDQYLLYVGSLDWHKNVEVVLEAVAMLPPNLIRNVSLRIVGSEYLPHHQELERRRRSLGLPENFLCFEGHLPDHTLIDRMMGALCLVHPAYMEGFGLTPLEAMRCGAPVVCSTAGAVLDVVGDAALTFAPDAPGEAACAIKRLLTEPQLADELRARGYNRAKRFSWNRTSELAVTALNGIVGERRVHQSTTDQLRKAVIPRLARVDLPLTTKAMLLACAEPLPRHRRKIVIDVTSTLYSEARTGIQRVVKSITSELLKVESEERVILAVSHDDTGWYSADVGEGFFHTGQVRKTQSTRQNLVEGDILLLIDSSWEYYLSHGVNATRARNRGAKVVSCLYDLVPLTTSAFCDRGMPPAFSNWLAASLTYSDAFMCISKAVADELLSLLQSINFPRKIDVGYWHLGANFGVNRPKIRVQSDRSGERPMFLMVGTIEPRKGHSVAIKACSALWNLGMDFDLVIIGRPGWGTKELLEEIKQHPEFGSRLRWDANVGDETLLELYSECDALVAASFAEGFGLPIVEARQFGRPIIASDLPVFREVAGNEGVAFFTPGSWESLFSEMRKFISEPAFHPAVSSFRSWVTWTESALELHRVITEDKWYKTYQPRTISAKPLASAKDLVVMRETLDAEKRRHELEVVTGPVCDKSAGVFRFAVRVTNCSEVNWSSEGLPDGRLAVHLGCSGLRDARGRFRKLASRSRFPIPLVLGPGESHIMPLEIPLKAVSPGSESALVQLMQQGVGWWEPGLWLNLPRVESA